ncbi:hypothetical protein ACROYT_G017302 [Oculina patagonica]
MDMFQQISNEAGYDVIEARNDEIIPVGDLDGEKGDKGDSGVGFKLTSNGNYDMDKKKIFGLKTQDDVAFDADLDTYAKDLSSAVNKRYVNQFLMKKNSDETHFDCVGLSLQNTEVYYPSLYNDRSVPNVGYVSAEDNKVRTEIDTKLATKADRSYVNTTYLTKKTGGVLSNSIQSKADKFYVDNTFLKKVVGRVLTQKIQSKLDIDGSNSMQANLDMNSHKITNLKSPTNDTDAVNKKYMLDHVGESHVQSANGENKFKYIMDDPNAQVSEEDDVQLGNVVTFQNSPHKVSGCKPNDDKSYTEAYQKHTDCGYGYKVVCCYDDKYTKPVQTYRGEKAVYKFMEKMLDEVKYCKQVMKKHFNKPLRMTKDDEEEFQQANVCHICDKAYTNDDIRVRDHCHITGKYRGSAHQECNLKLRIEPDKIKIPVIFHNLKGYDSHFIMQEIGAIVKNHTYKNKKGEIKEMNINAIANNMEKYMAFMLGTHLTFLDSFQFMSSSLEKLVSNLPKESLKYTSEIFKSKQLNLMSRKGIYPYDYMDSFDKFNEKLPKKEDFYSILNDEHISDDDYKHAKNVWKTFKIKNMGEYHDLYLKSDVLLLADVFESFRKTCLEYYKLDPCHYFTSPGLSWDAMLKMTDIKLELMTDVDMYQFIEKGMRGGISYIANRYGKANNKYMKKYNEKAPSKYLMYKDANNLYGFAMSQYLPTGGFRWLTQKQIDETNLAKYKEDSNKGLILEVDLEYPNELHNLHNDYPLGAEKVKVTKDMLSDYCKTIAEKYNISTGLVHKLIPTLNNKEKYVLHYRNLQLYLELGLKLTKVHRVLEFNQSPWLKQYIDFNTEKRKNAKNAFEKDFFKLMNNSVFGKTMENLRKRVDVRLVTDTKKLLKLTSKPTYVSSKIFNEDLVAVHKIKETLTLNRPAYVGMCILDLSKTLMYDFHYNYIKKKYGKRAKLLFTDTDSLTYEIQAEDVYQDFWNDRDKFDNSDYPVSSPFYDNTNKKISKNNIMPIMELHNKLGIKFN